MSHVSIYLSVSECQHTVCLCGMWNLGDGVGRVIRCSWMSELSIWPCNVFPSARTRFWVMEGWAESSPSSISFIWWCRKWTFHFKQCYLVNTELLELMSCTLHRAEPCELLPSQCCSTASSWIASDVESFEETCLYHQYGKDNVCTHNPKCNGFVVDRGLLSSVKNDHISMILSSTVQFNLEGRCGKPWHIRNKYRWSWITHLVWTLNVRLVLVHTYPDTLSVHLYLLKLN